MDQPICIFYIYICVCGILCDIMCLLRNILNVLPFFRSALNVPGDLWFPCISWCSFDIVMCVIPGETSYSYSPYQAAEHFTALVQCLFVFSLVSTGCIYPLVIQHNYRKWPVYRWFTMIYLYSRRLIFQSYVKFPKGWWTNPCPDVSSQARRQSFGDPKDCYSTYAVSLAMGIHVLICLV